MDLSERARKSPKKEQGLFNLTTALQTPKRASASNRGGQRVNKQNPEYCPGKAVPAQFKKREGKEGFNNALNQKEPAERELEIPEPQTRTSGTGNYMRQCNGHFTP